MQTKVPVISYLPELTTWKRKLLRIVCFVWFWMLDVVNAILVRILGRTILPKAENYLLMQSATRLAHLIRSGKVSSEEVIEVYSERICAVNGLVNAVVRLRSFAAITEARSVDKMIAAGTAPTEEEMPLLGVPFTIKDAVLIKDEVVSAGLATRRDVESVETAPIVERMRNAGAILLCTTNVSEGCQWWECHNLIYGTTKNPHDLKRTCGGSSGGEGALLGAAASVIGIGTDIGGSIRMPAAFCGIFGHKPSRAIVPGVGCYPPPKEFQKEMLSAGPMCRFADDLSVVLYILAEPTMRDSLRLSEPVKLSNVSVYYLEEIIAPYIHPLQTDVRRALWRTLSHYQLKYNRTCVKVDFPLMQYVWTLWYNDMSVSTASFRKTISDGEYDMNIFIEFCRIIIGIGRHTLAGLSSVAMEDLTKRFNLIGDADKWKMLRDELRDQVNALLGDNGVLILPAHPTVAPYINMPLFMPFNFLYTAIFNSLGVPATVCPVGISRENMPLSVQIIGAEGQDRLTIAVAKDLERAFGGSVIPP